MWCAGMLSSHQLHTAMHLSSTDTCLDTWQQQKAHTAAGCVSATWHCHPSWPYGCRCATVYRGIWRGQPVAVKEFRLWEGQLAGTLQQQLQQEVVAMSRVRHPHIIGLAGVVLEPLRWAVILRG